MKIFDHIDKIDLSSAIDLVVIRTNKHDQLRNSKPCCRCIEFMHDFVITTGIKIGKIYYSINDSIEVTTFDELFKNPVKHVPRCLLPDYNYNK